MVQDKKGYKVRPAARFKVLRIDNIESKPFECPRPNCFLRFKNLKAVKSHWRSHPSSTGKTFPVTGYGPTAGKGKILPKKKKNQKKGVSEALKEGRKKGQKAKTRIRDVEEMKEKVKAYEKALEEGETEATYIGSLKIR